MNPSDGGWHSRSGLPFRPHDGSRDGDRWQPNADIYETADAVVVVVDLAGVPAESVDVDVEPRAVRVAGVRRPRLRAGAKRISRLEIPQGPFAVTVRLPAAVDPTAAQARMEDGLLELYLPVALPFRPLVASPHAGDTP